MTLDQIREYWLVDPTCNNQRMQHAIIYDYRVMLVAVIDPDTQEWCAYIAGVPGVCHEVEQFQVRSEGTWVPESFARMIFKNMPEELTYYEDL